MLVPCDWWFGRKRGNEYFSCYTKMVCCSSQGGPVVDYLFWKDAQPYLFEFARNLVVHNVAPA